MKTVPGSHCSVLGTMRAMMFSTATSQAKPTMTMPPGSRPFVGSSRISGQYGCRDADPLLHAQRVRTVLVPALAGRPERSSTGSTAERGSCPRRARA
jgi:hypothetical protein